MPCLVLLAACGSQTGKADATNAGSTAVKFTQDLYSGNVGQAGQLVLPSKRAQFYSLANFVSQRNVVARGIRVGAVKTEGNNASVTLEGTLCSSPRVSGGTRGADTFTKAECVTHDSVDPGPQQFKVSMQFTNGAWYVS